MAPATAAKAPAFAAGDRVAWHHETATQHSSKSVLRADAIPQLPDDHPDKGAPGTGQFGTIVGPANEQGTWWTVLLDPPGRKKKGVERVLTSDELVKIEEPDEPAA